MIPENLGEMAIKDVIVKHPKIGKILEKHEIGCVTCKVGICKLKDVVRIHYLPKEKEEVIFREIDQTIQGGD
ncbi:MAG TPA: hypothetical protein VFF28_05520 [Candidatus Nanoarchaeia archaeon]|nr:hypothetical protein [Candidatus Nanoarchaeia archaeon]